MSNRKLTVFGVYQVEIECKVSSNLKVDKKRDLSRRKYEDKMSEDGWFYLRYHLLHRRDKWNIAV